jgi:hypothetical protein
MTPRYVPTTLKDKVLLAWAAFQTKEKPNPDWSILREREEAAKRDRLIGLLGVNVRPIVRGFLLGDQQYLSEAEAGILIATIAPWKFEDAYALLRLMFNRDPGIALLRPIQGWTSKNTTKIAAAAK